MKKIGLILFVLVALSVAAILLMVLFSPYGSHENYSQRLVLESILIDASVEDVYAYLGDSNNAALWSVFVNHITPLNDHEVEDGTVNSKRRCYTQADEKGMWWDEEVRVVEAQKRRQLICTNFNGFYISAGDLLTEQLYERIDTDKCKLTFTLYKAKNDDSLLDEFKFYYAGYTIASVFRENLGNVKEALE